MKKIANDIMERAKEMYVQSHRSMRSIAKELGCSESCIYTRYKNENWLEQRDAWRKAQGLEPIVWHREKRDWAMMKTDFITGDATYKDLAKKYNCPVKTISDYGVKHGWYRERLEYRKKLGDATAEEALKRRKRSRHAADWDAIRTAYITSEKTLDELAEEYGICFVTLRKRYHSEGWKQMRTEARIKVTKDAIERKMQEQVEEICSLLPSLTGSIEMTNKAVEIMKELPGLQLDELVKVSHILRNLEPVDRILNGRLTPTEQLRRDEIESAKQPQVVRFELSPELDELAR